MKKIILLILATIFMFSTQAFACKAVVRAVDTENYLNTDCVAEGDPDLCCEGPGVGTCTAEDAFLLKIGYVVAVYEDDFVWDDAHYLPIHWRINVNGATKTECEEYISEKFGTDGIPLNLRKHKLNPNAMPANVRNKLLRDGEITVNFNQVVSYFELIL